MRMEKDLERDNLPVGRIKLSDKKLSKEETSKWYNIPEQFESIVINQPRNFMEDDTRSKIDRVAEDLTLEKLEKEEKAVMRSFWSGVTVTITISMIILLLFKQLSTIERVYGGASSLRINGVFLSTTLLFILPATIITPHALIFKIIFPLREGYMLQKTIINDKRLLEKDKHSLLITHKINQIELWQEAVFNFAKLVLMWMLVLFPIPEITILLLFSLTIIDIPIVLLSKFIVTPLMGTMVSQFIEFNGESAEQLLMNGGVPYGVTMEFLGVMNRVRRLKLVEGTDK